MAIVPWSALGSGQLLSSEQRREKEKNSDVPKQTADPKDLAVSEALEKIANERGASFQATVGPIARCRTSPG